MKTFKTYGNKLWFYTDGLFCINLFWFKLHIKNTHKHPLIFSERSGYQKTFKIKNYSIKFIKAQHGRF